MTSFGGRTLGRDRDDIIDAGVKAIEFDTTDLVEDDSLVIEAGRNVVPLEVPDGRSIANPGQYLVVYRRQADGTLKLVFDGSPRLSRDS
jgi:ketosteroid isomerase-like protein